MLVEVLQPTPDLTKQFKSTDDFRNYGDSKRQQTVEQHYKAMREHQTLEFVLRMKEKFSKLNNAEMTIFEALDALGDFVDASDPDTAEPNVFHLYQTAEGIRASGEPDWMQLVGLIHDLGKLLYKYSNGAVDGQDGNGGAQWGIVGDTFVVGCRLPDNIVFPHFNQLNPDMSNPSYNTQYGIYTPHCGLDNTHCAFGHDEYLFMVLKNHKDCKIPQAGLDVIRYHSLYPWHHGGEYKHLMNDDDYKKLEQVKKFQKHDLYTKHGETPNIEELNKYYGGLIEKYVPGKLKW
jgi:inositol oxygenase